MQTRRGVALEAGGLLPRSAVRASLSAGPGRGVVYHEQIDVKGQ